MFGLSMMELLVILLVALLVLDPKDIPVILRTLHRWWKSAAEVVAELRTGVSDVMRESGADDIRKATYIEDMYGNRQRTYDISDLLPPRSDPAEKKE